MLRLNQLAGSASLAMISMALLGCPPGDSTPEEAPDCPTQFAEDFPDMRVVQVGDLSGGVFAPYSDGELVQVVKGNQGLFMVTPAVQVEAAAGDPEEACFRVVITSELGADKIGLLSNVRFLKDGDALTSDGVIFTPLTDSREAVAGVELTLTVKVQGEGFEGTKVAKLTLE